MKAAGIERMGSAVLEDHNIIPTIIIYTLGVPGGTWK
jgi:hypothetical protein